MSQNLRCARWYESPLGRIRLAADGDSVVGIWFDGARHFPASTLRGFAEMSGHPLLLVLAGWLDAYFAGKIEEPPDIPLKMHGSPFQQAVWKGLAQIPYGNTISYARLACRIGFAEKSGRQYARAVGAALGRNPFSILLPCHRVLGTKGQMTGYAGGLDKKQALLELEKRVFAGQPIACLS